MTDLKSITQSLRAAVDGGDLGKISEGVVAVERLVPETGSQGPCRFALELSRYDLDLMLHALEDMRDCEMLDGEEEDILDGIIRNIGVQTGAVSD